jgi:hypothetical protein
MYELSWKQFISLNHIRNLNERQQVMEYNLYLESLTTKGKSTKDQTGIIEPYSGFLLQENLDFILQENGDKIFL